LVVGVALGEDLTMARVEVDGLGAGLVLVDAFGVAFAFAVVVFVGVFVGVVAALVGVAAGLDFSVRVGAAVALADAVAELEALAVALGVASDDALVVVCVGVPDAVAGVAVGVVGVAVGVVGVALGVVGVALGVELGVCEVGVGEVGVGEGDGLAGAAGSCSGSQDSPLAVEAVLAAAVLAATVRLAPEASRTLPAMSVTVAGRACAKRIKSPISAARCGVATHRTSVPPKAPPAPHTRLRVRITATAGFRDRFFAEITGSGRLG
jgi:hypothetical protein